MDVSDKESCYYDDPNWSAKHPAPHSVLGFGKAFSSIMFAFAGASTFPTIQADMKQKSLFPKESGYLIRHYLKKWERPLENSL